MNVRQTEDNLTRLFHLQSESIVVPEKPNLLDVDHFDTPDPKFRYNDRSRAIMLGTVAACLVVVIALAISSITRTENTSAGSIDNSAPEAPPQSIPASSSTNFVDDAPKLDSAEKAAAIEHVVSFIGLLDQGDASGADLLAAENVFASMVLVESPWLTETLDSTSSAVVVPSGDEQALPVVVLVSASGAEAVSFVISTPGESTGTLPPNDDLQILDISVGRTVDVEGSFFEIDLEEASLPPDPTQLRAFLGERALEIKIQGGTAVVSLPENWNGSEPSVVTVTGTVDEFGVSSTAVPFILQR